MTFLKRHYLESFLAIANSYESLLRDENDDSNVTGNSTLFVGLFCGVNKINPRLITKGTTDNLPLC